MQMWARTSAVAVFLGFLFLDVPIFAVEAVSDNPNTTCEEIQLKKPLRVYKDPALYPSNPGLMEIDPTSGLATPHAEDPLLSTFTGTFRMKRMSPPRRYRGFETVARVYALDDAGKTPPPKAKLAPQKRRRANDPAANDSLKDLAVQIQICGDNDPYAGTFGLVFLRDLQEATTDNTLNRDQVPPSVNSIPNLNDYPSTRNL